MKVKAYFQIKKRMKRLIFIPEFRLKRLITLIVLITMIKTILIVIIITIKKPAPIRDTKATVT